MKSIYKYELTSTSKLVAGEIVSVVHLPLGSEVLKIDIQGDKVCLWAMVNVDETETEERKFIMIGTGMQIPDDAQLIYNNTILIGYGTFVYHAFETK